MRIVERINRVLYKVNKLSLLFQILVIAFLLCGCAGAGDWASEPLVANYEIWLLSGHDIELVKRTGESSARSLMVNLITISLSCPLKRFLAHSLALNLKKHV